jgi:ATP/maltotriose-dependent transcriptional regulator MalT
MGSTPDDIAAVSAKFTRPTSVGSLRRTRLFKHLDKGRNQTALWVSGPAGSGKTTLVSSYAESRKLPALWYQTDGGDADIPTFFYYLGLAVRQANRRKRKPMPLLTPEYLMGGVPAFSRRFFEETFTRLKSPSIIVFDNYQEVPADAELHDVILEGLARVPGHVTVIFVSRTHWPAPFARLKANGEMGHVGWEELRLTPGETGEIARLRGHGSKGAEELHEKAGGWAAGLVLLLEGAAGGDRETSLLAEGGTAEVFDYFVSEVFRKAEEETRAFLLETSFLPHMTAAMAAEVAGTEQAGRLLSDRTSTIPCSESSCRSGQNAS